MTQWLRGSNQNPSANFSQRLNLRLSGTSLSILPQTPPSSTSTANLLVYLGRLTQGTVNTNEESRTVSQIIRHPDYNAATFDNDICLLRLSSDVPFTNFIVPVCLAASGSVFSADAFVWVTGWGNIESGGESESEQRGVCCDPRASWSRSC